MSHVWLVTPRDGRRDQDAAGAELVRVNHSATASGLGTQPLGQAFQEYPEMASVYAGIHRDPARGGGPVQLFARIGHGPEIRPARAGLWVGRLHEPDRTSPVFFALLNETAIIL